MRHFVAFGTHLVKGGFLSIPVLINYLTLHLLQNITFMLQNVKNIDNKKQYNYNKHEK